MAAEIYADVLQRSRADGILHDAVVAAGMLVDVLLVQDRTAPAADVLADAERMAHGAPDDFQVALWVRRARLHRLRGELPRAAELLDRSAAALDPELLVPEQVVWYVERVAVAAGGHQVGVAQSILAELNARTEAAGMVIPPWEVRHLTDALAEA